MAKAPGAAKDGWSTILMAAGKGVRMHSSRPKVLHRVAGVPMIGHAAAAARDVASDPPVIVVSPSNRDAIAEEMGDAFAYVEQPEPLGTGHALAVALEGVPFESLNILLLNGDMPLITADDLRALSDAHATRKAAITVGVATLAAEDALDLGTLKRGARAKPVAIVEAAERTAHSAKQPSTVEVAVGAFALDATWARGAMDRLATHAGGEYYVTDLVALAVADGLRVEAVNVNSVRACIGVNTRSQLAKAEQEMQQRLRHAAMDAGTTMTDPSTVYLDASVELAADVTILPNTTLSGATSVGEGAMVGPNAQISDTAIGTGAVVGSAVIKGSTIGPGAQVGPFTLVREGSQIDEDAYVGAHAEIKASHIGKGTHVGHFSYVGDAVLGENVNIGAGTVTCNYDGKNKHVTNIGDGAFIGSGSMLVAPINIGAGALTAAGAVVNKDVGPGERVAGVPARQIGQRSATADEEGKSLG
jgi:bifunctional UDP-N-acetylglucosamine pyrophosphorylase / glucosamine-1-phosphate N-acetyltransferase